MVPLGTHCLWSPVVWYNALVRGFRRSRGVRDVTRKVVMAVTHDACRTGLDWTGLNVYCSRGRETGVVWLVWGFKAFMRWAAGGALLLPLAQTPYPVACYLEWVLCSLLNAAAVSSPGGTRGSVVPVMFLL